MSPLSDHHLDPTKKHDFVLLFDVTDGNPNGDPDAGNMPRVDPETMQGLVTDVAIKRKVRDYISITRGGADRYRIYVQNKGVALNDLHKEAYDAAGIKSTGSKQKRDEVERVQKRMTETFADIRLFGAVMTTGVNAGQVRGPVQITFARSADPIVPLDLSITRVAVTKPEDLEAAKGDDGEVKGKRTEMGRKPVVPYGLYRAHGFFNPHYAKATGVTSEDLGLFWQALQRAWEIDRSSARGLMACRGVHVFTHDDPYGNAPAHALLERVNVQAVKRPPRTFADYKVDVRGTDLPKGVHLTTLGW